MKSDMWVDVGRMIGIFSRAVGCFFLGFAAVESLTYYLCLVIVLSVPGIFFFTILALIVMFNLLGLFRKLFYQILDYIDALRYDK